MNLGRFFWKLLLTILLVLGAFWIALATPSPAFAKTKYSNQQEALVYITRTGKKYHRGGCRWLKWSRFKVTRTEALERGYGACKVCRP